MTWRCDTPEESLTFATKAEADAREAEIRLEKVRVFVVTWEDGGERMTPEQARRAYEAMSPETKVLFEEFVGKVCDIVTRLDNSLTEAGQAMADDVETWIHGEPR